MTLIPADMAAHYQQQQHLPGVPTLTQLSNLDEQMKSILEDSSTSADLKFKLYYNALQRYEAFQQNATQKPDSAIPAQPPRNLPPAAQGPRFLPAVEIPGLIDHVPKAQRRATTLLLNYVKDNPDLEWNEARELVYQGQRIPQSNVYDLVSDISRNRKLQSPAVGWEEFASALINQNVPQGAIGNKQRWNYMKQKRDGVADDDDGDDFTTPVTTPTPNRRTRRRQRMLSFNSSSSEPTTSTARQGSKKKKRFHQTGKGRVVKWDKLYKCMFCAVS